MLFVALLITLLFLLVPLAQVVAGLLAANFLAGLAIVAALMVVARLGATQRIKHGTIVAVLVSVFAGILTACLYGNLNDPASFESIAGITVYCAPLIWVWHEMLAEPEAPSRDGSTR